MMNSFLTEQQIKKLNNEALKKLRGQILSNFLEHTMYDINDALASILALCDMEDMKSIPKVKKYIQKVNSLLEDLSVYQNDEFFNVNHVLKNIIDLIKDDFKQKANIEYAPVQVNALVKSKQTYLEDVLLCLFFELVSKANESQVDPIVVDLRQKDRDAVLTITKKNFSFSTNFLKDFDELKGKADFSIRLSPKDGGVEVVIKMPLEFNQMKINAQAQVNVVGNIQIQQKTTNRVGV
jgi:hypothetical protein